MARQHRSLDFGKKLHQLRLHNDLTLQQLATVLGYSTHSYLSEIESGKKVPTVELVLKVSETFDVSTDQLIRDELNLEGGDRWHPPEEGR